MTSSILLNNVTFTKLLGFPNLYSVNYVPVDVLNSMDDTACGVERSLARELRQVMTKNKLDPLVIGLDAKQKKALAAAKARSTQATPNCIERKYADVVFDKDTDGTRRKTFSDFSKEELITEILDWQDIGENADNKKIILQKENALLKKENEELKKENEALKERNKTLLADTEIVISDDDKEDDDIISWEQKFLAAEQESKFWQVKFNETRALLEKAVAKINKLKAMLLAR